MIEEWTRALEIPILLDESSVVIIIQPTISDFVLTKILSFNTHLINVGCSHWFCFIMFLLEGGSWMACFFFPPITLLRSPLMFPIIPHLSRVKQKGLEENRGWKRLKMFYLKVWKAHNSSSGLLKVGLWISLSKHYKFFRCSFPISLSLGISA